MAILKLESISYLPVADTRFCGAKVNCRPRPGQEADFYALEVDGWVLGRMGPATGLEVVDGGTVIYQVPVALRWQEPMTAFPDVAHADRCAFRVLISALRLGPEFELLLRARFGDGSYLDFALMKGRRGPLQVGAPSKLLPLMVTTLGRTGSTWLVALLAQHPQLIAYRPFDYETRVISYWLGVFRGLAEPVSYTQCLRGELSPGPWWLGDQRPSPPPPLPVDAPVREWLGRDHIRALGTFCRNRIVGLFEQIAAVQQHPEARYFVEKFFPDSSQAALIAELFPSAGEIFLVRDFRDMFCSMLTFGKKLGRPTFGRERTNTDEEFARLLQDNLAVLLQNWKERAPHAHLLRYEDLIQRPREALRALLNHFQLDSSDAIIENMLRGAPEVMPKSQQFHRTSATAPDSVGRWRDDLAATLKQTVCDTFAEALTAFGYTPE